MTRALVTGGLLATAVAVAAAGMVSTTYVDFPKGYEGRTYTRVLKGDDMADYLIRKVEDEQKYDVTISSSNKSIFFDVYDPSARDPRFVGWKEGEKFSGRFQHGGTVKVRVYQRYDVAARNETASYTLTIVPGGVPAH